MVFLAGLGNDNIPLLPHQNNQVVFIPFNFYTLKSRRLALPDLLGNGKVRATFGSSERFYERMH